VSGVLADEDDAFGHCLLDHLAGRPAGELLLERDDGSVGPGLAAPAFFAPYAEWPAEERTVFDLAHGRVLDVGCGAGRHSLEAQARGLSVVAIDVSPGAVAVSSRRGVRDVRLLALAAVDAALGSFDTVLMMCGNFGLVGTAEECARTLGVLREATAPGARIVLDTVDPSIDNDEADLAYAERNRERGRMPGQVTIRLRYGERATPWFDLLNVSPDELAELAAAGGWRLATILRADEEPDWYAVLEKIGE
jgi:SAM-dependent methyltransferase